MGHLRSLQKLFIESMNGVRTIGSELLRPTNSCPTIAFLSLEVLKFKDIQCWEKWSTGGGDNNGVLGSFPRLREFSAVNCPKLTEMSIVLIPSLELVHIEECSEVVLRSIVGVSSSIITLTMWRIRGLTQLHGEIIKNLGAVEDLCITGCDDLRYLWKSESEACKFLVCLRKLEVNDCKMLISLVEEEVNLESKMESVREVSIQNCEKLESYNCPNSIERLLIFKMTSLTFPTVQVLPSTLKILRIRCCENLEESWLLNNFLSSLESLICNNMRSLREGSFVYLTKLGIWNCDNLESIPEKGFGFLPLFCLRVVLINRCKNLKSFPHVHLQSLTSLEEFWIKDCPNIDYSFPCGLWPPNLKSLRIGYLNKPMSEWGQQNYPTSLVELQLYGENSNVVSFAEAGTTSFVLPPSLTSLGFHRFEDLESVSKGLQHLNCLEELRIQSCPKLRDLPEKLVPSLSSLWVKDCSKLEKKVSSWKRQVLARHLPNSSVWYR